MRNHLYPPSEPSVLKYDMFIAAAEAFDRGCSYDGYRPEDLPLFTGALSDEVYLTVQLQDDSIHPCKLFQALYPSEIQLADRRIPLNSPEVKDLLINRIFVEVGGRWFLLMMCNGRDILLESNSRTHYDIGLKYNDPRAGFGGWKGTVDMVTQARVLSLSILDCNI